MKSRSTRSTGRSAGSVGIVVLALRPPRGCDSACHACLLTYDTHHHVRILDRHEGLKVLSQSFIDGLGLPDQQRILGAATAVEFEPIELALARELHSANVLRLVLAGDPDEWELEAWPLRRQLARWMQDQLLVQLVIPASVMKRIDPASRNKLAAWSDADGIQIVQVPDSDVAVQGGWLLAEIGSGGRHVRFAVFTFEALTPNERWGVGPSGAHVVRARVLHPLAPLPPSAGVRDGASLRVTPAGTVAALTIRSELDGPVDSVGHRFWDLTASAAPELSYRLVAGSKLRRAEYTDRYVRSPIGLRVVAEVLRALHERTARGLVGADVRLVTLPIDSRRVGVDSRWIWDDWAPGANRAVILGTALAQVGIKADVVELPSQRIPHARELQLEWDDGAAWTIRLDEGFGFLRSGQRITHDFHAADQAQGMALLKAKFTVGAQHTTYAYLFAGPT